MNSVDPNLSTDSQLYPDTLVAVSDGTSNTGPSSVITPIVSTVPEPQTYMLLVVSLGVMEFVTRRR